VLLNRIRSGYGRFVNHLHWIGPRDNPHWLIDSYTVFVEISKRPTCSELQHNINRRQHQNCWWRLSDLAWSKYILR